MCDPLTLFGIVGGLASSLFTATSSPPKPEMPAAPAPTSRAPGATVRIGTGADELENTDPAVSSNTRMTKTRAAGSALGGLGKSSLAL